MKNLISKIKRYIRFSWRDTLITAGVFSAAFVICFVLQRFSENDFHVPLIFVLVVMIISRLTDGYFYGIIATALGVVSVNYVFTYPYFELDFTLTGYPLTFATMLLVSIVTCTMTTRIKNQERRIEEGEKEKIRADLLRGISHDIRTPVTGIAGSADVLLENEDLSENKRRELLIGIKEDTDWLIHMVENVLIVTRVGNSSSGFRKEPEAVEEVLSDAVYKFRKQWPDISVRVSVPEEVLFVPMDAVMIEQVILNLMHNSIIHGVSCDEICITVKQENNYALFSFLDNGQGFSGLSEAPQEVIPAAASGRGRADRHKNMGIGLSVCSTIIRAHDGVIRFSNAPDKGALVEFTLPLKRQGTAARTRSAGG